MQRSIGAAVERLAVDLYASRWDGTPRRLCPLCPLACPRSAGGISCSNSFRILAKAAGTCDGCVMLFRFPAFQVRN